MAKRISERSRWVTVFQIHQHNATDGDGAQRQHEQLHAVVSAFADIGRVLRLEPSKFSRTIVVKARRA